MMYMLIWKPCSIYVVTCLWWLMYCLLWDIVYGCYVNENSLAPYWCNRWCKRRSHARPCYVGITMWRFWMNMPYWESRHYRVSYWINVPWHWGFGIGITMYVLLISYARMLSLALPCAYCCLRAKGSLLIRYLWWIHRSMELMNVGTLKLIGVRSDH